jgi:hypothetical protein
MKIALVVVLVIFVAGCGKGGTYEPDQIKAIADSALIDAWKAGSLKTVQHSPAYDSLFRYYRAAAEIEKARLAIEDSLAGSLTILQRASVALNDTLRHLAIASFERATEASDSLTARLKIVEVSYGACVDTLLKHVVDTASRRKLRSLLVAEEKFAPKWRAGYDSLARTTNAVIADLLSLIDSARGNILFDSSGNRFRFRDLELTSRFNAFRDSLAKLGEAENAVRSDGTNPKR